MNPLTPRQQAVFEFITGYRQKHAVSPSFQEIQEHFAFRSPHAVTKHLQALEKKGAIAIQKSPRFTKARGIVPLKAHERKVPLVGRIAAGVPLETSENIEERIDLTSLGVDNSGGGYFALTVSGESMIGAHITEGDIVVIKKQSRVNPEDIAAVLWNGEATLKHVRKQDGEIHLIPENETMDTIRVTRHNTESFTILGKVVTVLRRCP